MKKLLLILIALFLWAGSSWAQMTVSVGNNTNTTPTLAVSYPSLSLALADLNAVTAMSGPISLTCSGSETAPSTGFVLGSASLNPVLNAAASNLIYIFGPATINAGIGTNATPSVAAPDGMFKLVGVDRVVIDGLTFTDGNSASATVANEFGVAMFKFSVTDGCNYNTIKNCTFNMQRISNGTGTSPLVDGAVAIGIYNSLNGSCNTTATPTTAAGTNSYNSIYTNTINGGNYGIAMIGYAGATPFTLCDTGNDIGGASAGTGNQILNYGGGAATNPAAGIRTLAQYGINVSYNTVNNNNGSGVNHATTLRGIYLNTAISASASVTYNTVSIKGGGTTTQVSAIENASGSTAASNTININNNTISGTYSTATTAAYYCIYNSATATTVNINYNTISSVSSAGTGTIYGVETGSPVSASVSNNSISTITKSGIGTIYAIKTTSPTNLTVNTNTVDGLVQNAAASTGSSYGFYSNSSAVNVTITNNVFHNFTSTGASSLYGTYEFGVTGLKTYQNNQIYDISTVGGTIYGIRESTGSTNDYSDNRIYNLTCTGGSAGAIYGIYPTSGTTNNIYRNRLYNFSLASAGPTLYGIYLAGGTTNNVYNNFVSDLRTPASAGTISLVGIYVSSGTTDNIFYNTVYLNASSTGANFGSAALYASTTPTLDMRDNVLVNVSVPNGTGVTAAYRRSSSTLTSYSNNSNANAFYAGATQDATHAVFFDGTTPYAMAAYKTLVSPRDAASFRELPPFMNVGSTPYNLHMQTTIATQCESGAIVVSTPLAITTDFDGDTRNISTPDVGADEFAGIGIDLSGPAISYTTLGNGVVAANRNFTGVTITDASSVNTTAGTKPRLYYKKSAGDANDLTGWKFVEANGSSSPFDFTIDYTLLNAGSVSAGDIIQYFVVAQDLASTPNISINSGTFAVAPSSVALTATAFPIGGTINSYNIVGSISGTFTVGTTGRTYATLKAAFDDINAKVVSGNIILDVQSEGTTETATAILNQPIYSGGTWTITIKPNSTATITGALASAAIIKLNGADNVVIDGSNSGGTDKSLTITNTSTTAPTVISLASLGTDQGASANTIKNCNISTGIATTLGYGIAVGGSTPGTSGADCDNVTIQNNAITVASIGVYAAGTASVSSGGMDNLLITGNSITSNSGALQNYGIQVQYGLTSSITGNTISVETTGAVQPVGISIETGFVSSSVSKNLITKVNVTNTGGYGGRGITIGTGAAASNLTVDNNSIYGVNGSNWSGFSLSSSFGIGIGVLGGGSLTTTTGGVNLFYNSVNMTGSMGSASTTAITTALYIGSATSSLDIRNNIFVNTQVGTSTTQKNYAIYSAVANTAFTLINYNDYFASNSFNAASAFLGFLSSDRVDLPAIVAGFGQNANSIAGDPKFISATNLHIDPLFDIVNNKATYIAAVTTDFDGETRSASTPDIGSDEYTYTPPAVLDPTGVSATAISGTQINVAFTPNASSNNVVIVWDNDGTFTTPTGAPPVVGNTFAGGTVLSNGTSSPVSHTGLTNATAYYYKAFSYNGADYSSGVTANATTPLGVPYTQNFNDALTLPSGWGGTFGVSATHGASATNGLYFNLWSSATTANTTSPSVMLGAAGNMLAFDYRIVNYSGYPATATTLGPSDKIDVEVSTNGGSSYTIVYTINSTNHITSTSFALKEVDLSAYNGQMVKIKLTATWASGDYYVDIDNFTLYALTNMAYVSSTTTQTNTTPVVIGDTDQEVIGIQVVTSGSLSPFNVTGFTVNATGTTNIADISNAKIYYTGTSSTFAATSQFGSTFASPTLANFSITGAQVLSGGTNYFWLTYDVNPLATESNVIDAQCIDFTTSEVATHIPTITNPAGSRTLRNPLSGVYTINNTSPTSGTNYNNFTDAIFDLNFIGISSAVTFNVSAGQTFSRTCPASPYNYAYAIATTGTAVNTITFQKSGGGANPILNITGTVATNDIGVFLYGTDYITFNGIDINDAGTTSSDYLESGFYLQGPADNNCSYVTIKNAYIDLNKNNVSSKGIYLYAYVPTSSANGNSHNSFLNNTIQDSYNGYYFSGNATYPDIANTIGIESAGTSYIQNIGNNLSTALYATFFSYQSDLTFSNTTITSVTGSGSMYGIYVNGGAGTSTLSNNIVSTFTGTSTSSSMYGIYSSPAATAVTNYSGNEVVGFDGKYNVYGVYLSTGLTTNVYNNTIHNIAYTGALSAPAYGLSSIGGTTNNIYNNFIYDIKAAASTGLPGAAGLSFSGGTTANVFYNTVLLNYVSTYASNQSAALYVTTSPTTLNMNNNIFVNKCDMTTGAYAVAFYKSSTSVANLPSSNNNNLFYAGTPGAKNLLYYDGINADQTIATMKSRLSPREAQSVTEDAPFISGVSPYNLHINVSTATQIESGGVRITTPIAITSDFDANIRQGETGYSGTGTAPDIGADEFNGIGLDRVSPSISYTVLGNTTSTSNRAMGSVAITDPGSGVNTTAGTKPRLYYKKSGDLNDITGWKYVEANGSSTPFDFTINYSSLTAGSVSVGDIIQYFVVAQDLAARVNVGINAGSFAVPASSVALTALQFPIGGTINQYTIVASVSGALTVGTGGSYTTFTDAGGLFDNINTKVVTGNITVTITSDITESGTIALNQWAEEGAGNYTLTIQPSEAVTKTISGTYAGALIRLNGADRVTFDGNFGGSGQYLTFSNLNTGTLNNTFALSNTANNNTIKHCKIYSAYRGITTTLADNTLIEGNEIYGDVAGNPNNNQRGIFINTSSTNTKIRKNSIHDFYYTGSTGYGCMGIYYASDASTETEISNNVIYAIKGDGDVVDGGSGQFNYIPSGIAIYSGGNIKIYNNSINLTGAVLGPDYTGNSSCIMVNSAVTLLDIRNNNLRNAMTTSGIASPANKTYAIASYSANSAFTNINFNNYYADGTNPYIGFLTSDRATLAAWKTATAQDASSYNSNPNYPSESNLKPSTGYLMGTYLASVTTDFEGTTRANPPAVGAFEGPGVDWANVQWPGSATISETGSVTVYAQVYEPGVTTTGGQGAGIQCWIGWNSTNTDPNTWTNWTLATYNTDAGSNDEYMASIGPGLTSGTYYYASRFLITNGFYQYGGYSGGFWNGGSNASGVLTVTPTDIAWANLQFPATATITEGGAANVYARVYADGITQPAGASGSIQSWIGWSTTNTDPSTWTNWTTAAFNAQQGNNDEYMASIGAALTPGTYYYASRFKYSTKPYVYGGYSEGGGGFWNGTTYIAGVLTVNAAVTNKSINVTVFLEGAYDAGGAMLTTLSDNSLVPVDQPYNAAPWNYTGTESVVAVPAGVVDWVLVDLRDAATPETATTSLDGWPKAYFLKSDGSIMGLDGTTLPDIGNPTITGNLYVVVRHRNHIAVMSSTGMLLDGSSYSFNFSTAIDKAFGAGAGYKEIEAGVFGMVAGDSDANGDIALNDYTIWAVDFGNNPVYFSSDNDLNGDIALNDYTKWAINFGIANPIASPWRVSYKSQVPNRKQ
ncbi:MAG: beta strand repeat-containing protein [Bacteroidales bacterium]